MGSREPEDGEEREPPNSVSRLHRPQPAGVHGPFTSSPTATQGGGRQPYRPKSIGDEAERWVRDQQKR
jgi:hypothetical protein